MFVDASAMIAIVAREPEAAALAARLGQAKAVRTSPIAVYEAILGLARIGKIAPADAAPVLDRFLAEARIEIIPITAQIGREAVAAFGHFGRGRHPAALNLGDCFAYACARLLDAPLLFKGDDFAQTDIAVA
ncbi:MAG TPA: type II toxin-antitoxin system VapC family toxin [Stellaceae bacterium]|nr:type II toxin-antitoxin system VapC family toxin [Stellaceae bacterium]